MKKKQNKENVVINKEKKTNGESSQPVKEYKPTILYLSKLKKDHMDEKFGKFLELFKQLYINLPYVEAFSYMPKYAKFLKKFLSNKKKLEKLPIVTLSKECSAILQNKLLKKLKDWGSFTFSYLISNLLVEKAFIDLEATINSMPC